MDLMTSLGVNSSLFIQFGLFVVVFLVLKHVLFQPYMAAYTERSERTVGKAELAERYVAETRALEEQFAQQAQDASEKFKAIYDKSRGETLREYDRVLNEARAKSKQAIEDNRGKIHTQLTAARTQLAQEVGAVSQLINQKLIGKDLKA